MRILCNPLVILSLGTVQAFMPGGATVSSQRIRSVATKTRTNLASAPPILDLNLARAEAKEALLETAKRLKSQYGTLLLEKKAKDQLKAAVEDLENKSEPPAIDKYRDLFLGDWTLLCTTAVNQDGVDTSKLPFLGQDPIKKIRDSVREAANKYLFVQQRVRSTNNNGVIDRVDNVIEYQPPDQLRELLDSLPPQISQLNINPLHVSKSKLVLIHKATIESELPLKTKIALQSIVLNVAGNSTYLDTNGKDVAGLNLPLGDFTGAGTFETTYMDDSVRISRGKQGFVDQLRVFIRTDRLIAQEALDDLVESIVDAEIEGDDISEEEDDDDDDPEIVAIDDEDNGKKGSETQ